MNPRLYRLIETLQRIDRALRHEQRRALPRPVQLLRLQRLKLRARRLIERFVRSAAQAWPAISEQGTRP